MAPERLLEVLVVIRLIVRAIAMPLPSAMVGRMRRIAAGPVAGGTLWFTDQTF